MYKDTDKFTISSIHKGAQYGVPWSEIIDVNDHCSAVELMMQQPKLLHDSPEMYKDALETALTTKDYTTTLIGLLRAVAVFVALHAYDDFSNVDKQDVKAIVDKASRIYTIYNEAGDRLDTKEFLKEMTTYMIEQHGDVYKEVVES